MNFRNKVYREILEEQDGKEIINILKDLDLTLIYTGDFLDNAWSIGSDLETTTLYDCFYIGLAEALDAHLWTSDKKLYNAAKTKYNFVHL